MENEVDVMEDKLRALLEAAKAVKMTPEEQEVQRRSFAYGNAHIENEYVTRETVAEAAEAMESRKKK